MNKATITWNLDMCGRVIFVCDANTAAIESVPALDDDYTEFKERVDLVKAKAQNLPDDDDNGYADQKHKVWKDLALSLNRMCGSLRSYARKNNNSVLLAQAKFTPSIFLKKRGTEAILQANNRLALLNTQVANLTNYNVTAADITAATDMSAELATLNPKPTGQRSVDKALRSEVTKHIKEIIALLKYEIDPLVRSLELDYPSFVQQYFNARRIVKTGIHHDNPEEKSIQAKEAAAPPLPQDSEPLAQQQEDTPAPDGGQPDTNGSHPPTESPNNGEPSGEMA